ncbi:cupin [Pseudomonas sp. CYM-20-01]|uniref:AraC family transcriptional regulator n=1 Tax=Pseudomonas sp. CYM-20-01 TaxID=2870750 RepID=UPI0020491AAB|nr:AraC family transcriptional regulator [Pseudomonas sp. CYM-20-01]BDB20771.1 cupin [Pseudomonas sp. CYM-20-01]
MPPVFRKKDVMENPNDYRPSLPLDDLLRTIRLTGVLQGLIQLASPWGCKLPRVNDCIRIHLVLAGSCVVYREGASDSICLAAGDALLEPMSSSLAIADAIETPLQPMENFIPSRLKSADSANDFLAGLFSTGISYGGGGHITQLVSMNCYVDKRFPIVMLKNMPGLVLLRGFGIQHREFLAQTLHQLSENGRQGFIGQAIATRLAEAVLTSAIRYYLDHVSRHDSKSHRGWNDPVLSKVFSAIYQAPESDWKIARLADKASLSRSAFLKRFASVTGQTPNEFITSLRMMRATELLENGYDSIAQIATSVGYASEASFSRAYHRWSGTTPGIVKKRRD